MILNGLYMDQNGQFKAPCQEQNNLVFSILSSHPGKTTVNQESDTTGLALQPP